MPTSYTLHSDEKKFRIQCPSSAGTPSPEQFSVKCAVIDGLGDVVHLDVLRAF